MAGGAQAQEAPHDILLKDQFGKADGPGRHSGQAVVLIYGKVDGMRGMKAWEDGFRKQVLGSVVVLRGLDARSVRHEKTEAEVNERRRSVPEQRAHDRAFGRMIHDALRQKDREQ